MRATTTACGICILFLATLLGLSLKITHHIGPNGLGYRTEAKDALLNSSLVQDKNFVITGCNVGIGKETARVLALAGANLFLGCRDLNGCNDVAEELTSKTGKIVRVMKLDLGSLKSIEEFAEAFEKFSVPLHTLILNAGLVSSYSETVDGFELNMGVNHVGNFYLTKLLMPSLRQANGAARVISLASVAHLLSPKIDFTDITGKGTWNKGTIGTTLSYAQSKAANILFAHKLNHILQKENIGTAYSLHPGSIITGLGRYTIPDTTVHIINTIGSPFLKSISQGAATTVFTATAPTYLLIPGAYYSDCNPDMPATDFQQADTLWEWTEDAIAKAIKNRTAS